MHFRLPVGFLSRHVFRQRVGTTHFSHNTFLSSFWITPRRAKVFRLSPCQPALWLRVSPLFQAKSLVWAWRRPTSLYVAQWGSRRATLSITFLVRELNTTPCKSGYPPACGRVCRRRASQKCPHGRASRAPWRCPRDAPGHWWPPWRAWHGRRYSAAQFTHARTFWKRRVDANVQIGYVRPIELSCLVETQGALGVKPRL